MKHTRVEAVAFDDQGVVADVAPTTTIPRVLGLRLSGTDKCYDKRRRRWRHLDLAGMRLLLRYTISARRLPEVRRLRVELAVPWAEGDSWFTRDFEEHTAYLRPDDRQDHGRQHDARGLGAPWATSPAVSSTGFALQIRLDEA